MKTETIGIVSVTVYADRACTIIAEETDNAVGYMTWGDRITTVVYVASIETWVPAEILMHPRISPEVTAKALSPVDSINSVMAIAA